MQTIKHTLQHIQSGEKKMNNSLIDAKLFSKDFDAKLELHQYNLVRNANKIVNNEEIAIRLATKFSIPSKLKQFCTSVIIIDYVDIPSENFIVGGLLLDNTYFKWAGKQKLRNNDITKVLVSMRSFVVGEVVLKFLPKELQANALIKANNTYQFNFALIAEKREC